MIASMWSEPGAKSESVPAVVTRRTRSLRRAVADTMLAAADTATSSESPAWAALRTSSSTVVRPCHGQLVLADQELVVAGGGGPVDAAEVVAHDVGPQRVEVLAGAAERVRLARAGQRVVAGGVRERVDLVDARVHGERRPSARRRWRGS